MNIASHLEKIRRLQSLRGRLQPLEDFELWFWSTMTAGTHAVNAALHDAGVTPQESAFPSQPGVYLVDDGAGGHAPALRAAGDVLHVGRPPIAAPVPRDVQDMMDAMEIIESYRDPCVRDGLVPTPEIVDRCDTAYRRCMDALERRLPESAA